MSGTYIYAKKSGAAYLPGGPLLFAMHGTGGNEMQFLDIAAKMMPDALIIAPRGDVSEYGALRYFKRTGEGRYDFDDLAIRTSKMAAFIAAKAEEHGSTQCHALGYSNGANIIASVIDKRPDLLASACLMHPLVTWQMAKRDDMKAKPVLITAGRRDPICPAPMTESLVDMLEARGAKVQAIWHQGGHEITQAEVDAMARFLRELNAE